VEENAVEVLRAGHEKRYALLNHDRKPAEDGGAVWDSAAPVATIGIFILLLGACLYFCRPILLPIMAALVIGTTLAPIVKGAARYGVPPGATAAVIVVLLTAAVGIAATLIAAPIASWIGRAPEIGAAIKEKLYVLDRPLSALRDLRDVLLPPAGPPVAVESSQLSMVTPVLSFVTPAVAQMVLFVGTLTFYLASQIDIRRYLASFFSTREAKLRFIRIGNDIEQALASYLATVTAINFCLGVAVGLGAWLFGLPNPAIFGILAAVLNYIPYIGPACTTLILFAVGLVTFPSLGYALVPPAAFVALTTIEGQFLTPAILGRRLTLNPLMVLLALAFWAWLWGPMGAFLAVPLSIVGLVTIHHLFPGDDGKLPG
jgi:predicted PurR-regulated permease PerM